MSSAGSITRGTQMAPEDPKAPFMHIPWAARMLNKPGVVIRMPGSRRPKASTEDSLYAEILNSSRTIRSYICFYMTPEYSSSVDVTEVFIIMTVGDGMNGHPQIMHGGIIATLCDEAMGVYKAVIGERAHSTKVKLGQAEGEVPSTDVSSFTAELKITYLRPVRTPGCILVTATRVKKEGRKEWMRTELKQCPGHREDDDGELAICAIAEGLFIEPRSKAPRL